MIRIKANNGRTLTLDDKYITLIDRNCHDTRMSLTKIKNGMRTGEYVAHDPRCKVDGLRDQYIVSMQMRRIGCCAFGKLTWDIIMDYVREAQAKSKRKTTKAAKRKAKR